MRITIATVMVLLVGLLLTGCAPTEKYDKGTAQAEKSIDCTKADAHIKALEKEKMHTSEQVAAGVTSVVPVGLVAGLLTGRAGDKAEIATGSYNEMLDEKIASIKTLCDVK